MPTRTRSRWIILASAAFLILAAVVLSVHGKDIIDIVRELHS